MSMTSTDAAAFDRALVGAAFDLAARDGWRAVTVIGAARLAGLDAREVRARFPTRFSILARFGVLADQAALGAATSDGTVRERLFDMLMRRFDVLQTHRAGVEALLRALPSDPATAVPLALLSRRSMGWMLQAAGVGTGGCLARLRVDGLLAVWLWTVRAWLRDTSPDLSATMAELDRALDRAQQIAGWAGVHQEVGGQEGGREVAPDRPAEAAPGGADPPPPATEI